MTPELEVSFLVLSVTGLLNAAYVAWKHYARQPLVCPFNEQCHAVTESKWGRIFFVRNELLGSTYFLAMILGMIAVMQGYQLVLLIRIASAAALAFSLFLVSLQKYAIQQYCFYCLVSALISLLLFLNALAL